MWKSWKHNEKILCKITPNHWFHQFLLLFFFAAITADAIVVIVLIKYLHRYLFEKKIKKNTSETMFTLRARKLHF